MVFIPAKRPAAVAVQRATIGNLATPPFCTGGWNTRDPLPSMPQEDAVILENYIVQNDKIISRGGFSSAAEGLVSNVESLFQFANASETQIISCAGDKIFTGLGAVPPTLGDPVEIGSGFASARWQGLMMNQFLLLFNGTDTPQKYDGTTLSANVFTGSGLTPARLVGATNFKNRLIAWENNACGFWYGGSDEISGALDFFDLSFVTKRGGYVVACASWSYDSSGGSGLQARLIIFLSTGEAIVYEGTDPGTAESWSIVGRYKVAPPISQRAILSFSGDILILNKYDLISFSAVFSSGETPQTQSKLVGAIKSAIASYGLNFGWELINFEIGGLIILNVPRSTNLIYDQYVINTRSGGCSKFTGMNARCFTVYNDNLYFGGLGKIYQALTGFDDDGEFISVDAQSAYNKFGIDKQKVLNYVQPYMEVDSDVNFNSSLNYDFKTSNLQANQLLTNSGNYWDTFFWDTVFWSSESEIRSVQYGASGQGMYVSYRTKAQIKQSLAFYSVLYSFGISNL